MQTQPKLRLATGKLPDSGKTPRARGPHDSPDERITGIARIALALACAATAVAFGAWPRDTIAADSPKAGDTIRADLLYHNYCSVCHGDRGDGRSRAQSSLVPPPKDFTTVQAIAELTRERMIAATAAGKPGTAMVGWSTQLRPAEIEAVVDYIAQTFMKPRATPEFARGRTLYAQNCSVCHGDRGRGARFGSRLATAPRDFGSPQARAELSRERMIAAVTHGKPGTPMTAFDRQLPAADIERVVDFIRVAFMGASPADASGTSAHHGRDGAIDRGERAAKIDMTLPFPGGLVGNPVRGRKFYDENCATCHGVKGDAQGPRAYFIRPKPRNFLSDESRATFSRPALFAGVSRGRLGSEMPAWSKVIDDQLIADVSEYVLRAFIAGDAGSAQQATTKHRDAGSRK